VACNKFGRNMFKDIDVFIYGKKMVIMRNRRSWIRSVTLIKCCVKTMCLK